MFRHHDEDDSNKKWRRHNHDIYDEDVENQQPSPHQMQPIILPQAFLHAPNTFKQVSHIGAMNKLHIIEFKKRGLQHAFMSQNPNFISKSFLRLYFRTLSQNPNFISKSFFLPLYFLTLSQNPSFISISFYHYISVHCPKTRAKPGVPATFL